MESMQFGDPDRPESLAHAMTRFITMFDVIRDGQVMHGKAEIPDDPLERSNHLKAASYYYDVSQTGICELSDELLLDEPIRNPNVAPLVDELRNNQPKTFAAGVDQIYQDILDSAERKSGPITGHSHALVFVVEYTRDPRNGEAGTEWIQDIQRERAATLSTQTAMLIASYLRMLGYEARSHSVTESDVDLNKLAVASGLAVVKDGSLHNPYMGSRFGLAAVTTNCQMTVDKPLKADPSILQRFKSHGPSWRLGWSAQKNAGNREPFSKRNFTDGEYPFEKVKRAEDTTTFIDHARVPRFPKRSDFFARAIFGDMGKSVQDHAKGGMYVLKSPIGACARRGLGALLLLQFGDARGPVSPTTIDPERNADNLKAASYFLSCDAVGTTEVPDWAYYSHDAGGNEMPAYHDNGVVMLIDQGYETMDGASGDDWIAVAQSMRAYLRFSLLGGIIGEQVRRLGYSARVHSVLDGDVLQPPLLLLSGLGEVSRIGEVILNPYLGPRLKSGVVTTNMPMTQDKPIDFGLQSFCNQCNKCARECPSGAISAGPKVMYNGYEIWKSDAEKCSRYRITNKAGAMCGRCMKTCPWNLQGLANENAFRWLAMKFPFLGKYIAKLDDLLGRGAINPAKKWWWDIELDTKRATYVRANEVNKRDLNRQLKLKAEDQTLAVYPADMMPAPWPVTQPLDRDAGIKRYKSLLSPAEYKKRLKLGKLRRLAPKFKLPDGPVPVMPMIVKRVKKMGDLVSCYVLAMEDGSKPPRFEAGAHVDVVVAPEYQRQYSLAGDPADESGYTLGILREDEGRGGSKLLHRLFREGRKIFVSRPRNHFPLDENADFTMLMAGGIGVTPMLAMAHRLHTLGKQFEFHYSMSSRDTAGFLDDLKNVAWADKVSLHISSEGTRADLDKILGMYRPGCKLYTCGPDAYMDSVLQTAERQNWPEEDVSREYFSVPDDDDRPKYEFALKLTKSNRDVIVPAEKTATEALEEAGINVPTKCSDGICGVCACSYIDGEVDHRDYVLSKKERERKIILCSSRAAEENGIVTLDL